MVRLYRLPFKSRATAERCWKKGTKRTNFITIMCSQRPCGSVLVEAPLPWFGRFYFNASCKSGDNGWFVRTKSTTWKKWARNVLHINVAQSASLFRWRCFPALILTTFLYEGSAQYCDPRKEIRSKIIREKSVVIQFALNEEEFFTKTLICSDRDPSRKDRSNRRLDCVSGAPTPSVFFLIFRKQNWPAKGWSEDARGSRDGWAEGGWFGAGGNDALQWGFPHFLLVLQQFLNVFSRHSPRVHKLFKLRCTGSCFRQREFRCQWMIFKWRRTNSTRGR